MFKILIGSGSGLFSLAARSLGAKVHSFDYDSHSVECTAILKQTYFPNDSEWTVEHGSILDTTYLSTLGTFDICYSWGVLHHTGALMKALHNAGTMINHHGLLYIALYNDQGFVSQFWYFIKKCYCSSFLGKTALTALFFPLFFLTGFFFDCMRLRNPLRRYKEHQKQFRGMSLIHDWRDWLGGFPYEPAKPSVIIDFYARLGFVHLKQKAPKHGFGNNEFLFRNNQLS
jgi:SAM-dependent methyltransferase